MTSAERKAKILKTVGAIVLSALSASIGAGNAAAATICQQVADVVKAQLPSVPATDLKQLTSACTMAGARNENKPSHRAKLVTLWLKQKVNPSAELISEREPSYWLYNDLVGFHKGQPSAYLSFWSERRGSDAYARYVFKPKSPLKAGDRVAIAGQRPQPVSFGAKPPAAAQFFRMPGKARPLAGPYQKTSFAESLAQLSIASAGIIPVGSTRIEYLKFFDVNHPKVNQLLTQLLLSPNPSADKTLLDLRGPTGSVQTELANLLPSHFQKIEANVKKRGTYVLVDRHTQGFKQILARFLQNKGAIVMGEPQPRRPGFARFFPLKAGSPAAYYLLQLPKATRIYKGIKAPTIDSPLANHLPYSNGMDTMLEKALAILK